MDSIEKMDKIVNITSLMFDHREAKTSEMVFRALVLGPLMVLIGGTVMILGVLMLGIGSVFHTFNRPYPKVLSMMIDEIVALGTDGITWSAIFGYRHIKRNLSEERRRIIENKFEELGIENY